MRWLRAFFNSYSCFLRRTPSSARLRSRTLTWAAYFHYFQNPSRYPPEKLGRLIGYSNLFLACTGDGPPIGLFYIANSVHAYTVIHATLACAAAVLMAALVLYLRPIRRGVVEKISPLTCVDVAAGPVSGCNEG